MAKRHTLHDRAMARLKDPRAAHSADHAQEEAASDTDRLDAVNSTWSTTQRAIATRALQAS